MRIQIKACVVGLLLSLMAAGCAHDRGTTQPDTPRVTDGKQLHGWCTTPSMAAACLFYIAGVGDGAQTVSEISGQPLPYCAPETLDYGQAMQIVSNYLDQFPQYHERPADILIMFALRESFPCDPSNRKIGGSRA